MHYPLNKDENVQSNSSGYREIEHTADWEIEVWSPDIKGLLYQAACAMYTLADVKLAATQKQSRTLEITAKDNEEQLGFDRISLSLNEDTLTAELTCTPIKSISKEIKAVTYHNLNIIDTSKGFTTRIVFDV
jgi:SHS2 domain-containing protein